MSKLFTTTLLLSSLLFGSMNGCSPRLKSEGHASSSPSPQSDSDHASKPAVEPTRSANWNEEGSENAVTSEVKDELHTPTKGSPERQAMMDALRAAFDDRRSDYYSPHRGNITFIVNYLQVHNGWAWTFTTPQSSDKDDSFGEYSGFLLHQQGEQWQAMKLPPMVNDPNDPENLDYPSARDIERIRRMYPIVPADIFPKAH